MTSVTSSNLGHFKASSSESPFPALPVALGPGSLYTTWQQRVEALASMPASSPLASAGLSPVPPLVTRWHLLLVPWFLPRPLIVSS